MDHLWSWRGGNEEPFFGLWRKIGENEIIPSVDTAEFETYLGAEGRNICLYGKIFGAKEKLQKINTGKKKNDYLRFCLADEMHEMNLYGINSKFSFSDFEILHAGVLPN